MSLIGKSIGKAVLRKHICTFKSSVGGEKSQVIFPAIAPSRVQYSSRPWAPTKPQNSSALLSENITSKGSILQSHECYTGRPAFCFFASLRSLNTDTTAPNAASSSAAIPDASNPVKIAPSTPEEEEEKRKKDAFARKAMKWSLIAMGISFAGGATMAVLEWGQPPKDENGEIVRDEFSDKPVWQQYIQRAWKELVFYEKMIKEPSREKLLPDPLKEPYHQPPYTLVLEMTGVMVHPDWTYGTGWRFKKRPGVEYFLEQLAGPFFEVVVYTSEQAFTAFPILMSLDPNNYIMYRLFRDSTRYEKGKHVKVIGNLNRDLSKVIVVDWDPEAIKGYDRNALILPRWTGTDGDKTLIELAMFLKTIAASGVEDVREVLDNYKEDGDVLEAFKRRQELLREEQIKLASAISHQEQEKKPLGSWTPSIFGRRQ